MAEHCDEWADGYDQGYYEGQRHGKENQAVSVALDYLRQIRMGYTLDVTLRDVLEEIERSVQ